MPESLARGAFRTRTTCWRSSTRTSTGWTGQFPVHESRLVSGPPRPGCLPDPRLRARCRGGCRATSGYARAIPQIVAADIRANLDYAAAGDVRRAHGIAGGFGGFAEPPRHDVPRVFAAVEDPQAQKDLQDYLAANENAARAMESLKAARASGRERAPTSPSAGRSSRNVGRRRSGSRFRWPSLALGRADLERNAPALRAACAFVPAAGPLSGCVQKVQARQAVGRRGRRCPRPAGCAAQLRHRPAHRLGAERGAGAGG